MCAKILIIDDLEPNIKLLEAKLATEYYEVLSARSGQAGIEILANNDIDLILLDVMMPEMDGFETCRKIKSNPKNINVPIVMITSIGDANNKAKGFEAGADDFITKPIVDSYFFTRIKSLIKFKEDLDELYQKSSIDIGGIHGKNLLDEINNASILIIDDDTLQAAGLKACISSITEKVTTIENSEDAKDITFIPDLIIISSQLIEEDVLRVCSKIINNTKFKDIPVFVLVDEEDSDNILLKAFEVGVTDYLTVPVDEGETKVRISTQIKKCKLQKKLINKIETKMIQAEQDQLTGLYNRYYFDSKSKEMMAEAIKNNQEITLMVLDIDHFKSVNDTYGHLCGDEVLKEVAARVKANVRSSDLVARFGGEEFLVLMGDTPIEGAMRVAEKIRSLIEAQACKISHEKGEIIKTVSIGIAKLNGENDSITELIARADKALYQAKETGRNQVIVFKE